MNTMAEFGAKLYSVYFYYYYFIYIYYSLSYFSFQPVLHDWCNKGRGMCYPACGMVHIKEPLLLIGKSGSGFPLSLSETPYNRKLKCVECVVK